MVWAPITYLFYMIVMRGEGRNTPQRMGTRTPHRKIFGSPIAKLLEISTFKRLLVLYVQYMNVSVLAMITFLISLFTKILVYGTPIPYKIIQKVLIILFKLVVIYNKFSTVN